MFRLEASIHAGVPWPSRVGLKVRNSIGALGSRAWMNERIRGRSTVPSGLISGDPSTIPISAMFIGVVDVSAQSAHRSGTGTRTIAVAWGAAASGAAVASPSTMAFILRRS